MKGYNIQNKIKKTKIELMLLGTLTTILSSIGLFAFAFGFNTIHPVIYSMTMIMGCGLFTTGCLIQ